MNAISPAAHEPLLRTAVRRSALPWLMVAAWTLLWLFQCAAEVNEAARRATEVDLAHVLLTNAAYYPPWIVFSVVLMRVLAREPLRLMAPAVVLRRLALSALLFYVPYVLYEVGLAIAFTDRPWSDFLRVLARAPGSTLFVDFIMFCSCFVSVYAVAVFRQSLTIERKQQRAESENLALRLQLEHQRLAALQAQLEPHFLFNALNAISGLVRGDDRSRALGALGQLSELLRYALAASQRDRTTLGEEIDFVRGYLSLQALRHGERLDLRVDGETAELRHCDCPPLLLQPLVENALRHDLECHTEPSDLQLSFSLRGEQLQIDLSNPLRQALPPNPGLGLGLRNTRDRLALVYHGAASLETRVQAGRFELQLQLPAHIDD